MSKKNLFQIYQDMISRGIKVSSIFAKKAMNSIDEKIRTNLPLDEKDFKEKETCPPKNGITSCPMTFRYIPNGESVDCPNCGKKCNGLNINL